MKSENEDGESEKKNHGKYNPKRETREKAKTIGEDGREGKEGGRERPGDLT